MTNRILKISFIAGQSRKKWRAVSILLVFCLALGGVGCSSIYRRSRALLPPDPLAQLKVRVDEAHRAEQLAQKAGARLRDRPALGLDAEAVEIGVDRVEAAAFEFERRVASARDAPELNSPASWSVSIVGHGISWNTFSSCAARAPLPPPRSWIITSAGPPSPDQAIRIRAA